MQRERATRMLERICQQIDSGDTPVSFHGLWVFGSYARGATSPGDLDIVVLHGSADRARARKWKSEARQKSLNYIDYLCYPQRKLQALVGTTLRRPGESIDILTGKSFKDIEDSFTITKKDCTFLWSPSDRDWRTKLAGIRVDTAAKSFEHGLFMKPKAARCDWDSMEHLTEMLRQEVLVVSKIGLGDVEAPPTLSAWPEHVRSSLELASRYAGKKRRECLPFAFQWLIDQGEAGIYDFDNEVRSDDGQFKVLIGNLYPYWISRTLCDDEYVSALAHILHFRRGTPREILVFRRGPRWRERTAISRALQEGFVSVPAVAVVAVPEEPDHRKAA